jgi:hypothetical protein
MALKDETGALVPTPLGPQLMGVAEIGEERMAVVVVDGRAALPVDVPNRLLAYSGLYTFDGSTLTTTVDAASDPALVGTTQTRSIMLDGSRMVATPLNEIGGVRENSTAFTWQRIG